MPKIVTVETRTAPFSSGTWLDEDRISTPLSWYPRFADRRSSWRGPGSDLVWVLLRDEDGVIGLGQSRGGSVTAAAIREHLAPLLIGQEAAEVVRLREQLMRAMTPYAHGLFASMAVSAVELALWDLSARSLDVPLFRLLGGSEGQLPYYVTIGSSDLIEHVDGLLAGTAVDIVKVPMAWGPGDGPRGLVRNIERVELLRQRLDPSVRIAVDCFGSWNGRYANEFARAARDLGVAWIEEPLPYDDVTAHRRLRDDLSGEIALATGEHLAGIRVAEELIVTGAIDVIQTDITWCGGLAIANTIASIAQAHSVTFAPHASALQPWALHMISASGPDSIAELLVMSKETDVAPPSVSTSPGIGMTAESAGFR